LDRPDLIPGVLDIISLFTVATRSIVNPLIYAFLKPDFKVFIRNACRKNFQTKDATKKPSIPSSPRWAKTEQNTNQKEETIA